MSSSVALTYDEVLTQHVGQLGRGQLLSLFWASTHEIANAAALFIWVFLTVDAVANHTWRCTDPADAVCMAVWQQDSPDSHTFCSLRPDQWQWTSQDSLVAKFNLVCANAWQVQFANSLVFMGAFLGSGLFGFLCDSWGRRKPLFLATSLVAVTMLAGLAAPSFWVMAVLRCIAGIGAAGQTHTAALLSVEPVGPDYRGLAAVLNALIITAGEFLLVGLAYALPAWNHLLLAGACVNLACLLVYPWTLESARWLLSMGRLEEATAILEHTARANKTSMPAQPLVGSFSEAAAVAIVTDVDGSDLESDSPTSKDAAVLVEEGKGPESKLQLPAESPLGVWQVLRQRQLALRLAVLLLNWFALYLSYYGITVASGNLPGSVYVTFTIGVACEMVALLLVASAVDRVGRHNILALGQLLGGAACLACAMAPGRSSQAALAGIGKLGSSAAKAVIGLYTAELLPTTCRSSITGICRQVSRLGSIAAPFLLMLAGQLGVVGGHNHVFITFTVFGSLAVLAGLLTLLLPETLGACMPETIEDLDKLQSVFAAKPWREGCLPLLRFMFSTRAPGAPQPTAHFDPGSA